MVLKRSVFNSVSTSYCFLRPTDIVARVPGGFNASGAFRAVKGCVLVAPKQASVTIESFYVIGVKKQMAH